MTRTRSHASWRLSLLVLLSGASVAWAQQRSIESDFPVFGVGAGQIFRFGVAAVEDAGAPCQATLSFQDTNGRPIGGSMYVDLGPDESAFLDLDTRVLGLKPRQRIGFRPALKGVAGSGPCGALFGILDALTGRAWTQSAALTTFETLGPTCPTQDVGPALLLAFGTGQTLQVSVVRSTLPFDVNNDPLPCDVTLEIRDGGPATPPVATLVTGPLLPGQSAAVSVPFSMLGKGFGQTAFLNVAVLDSPVVIDFGGGLLCPATSSVGCKLSTQVIDNLTQWTTLIWIP